MTDVSWSFMGSSQLTKVILDVPATAAARAPLVVLLHGTNGDVNHMSNPALSPGFNYERFSPGQILDRGWHPYPNVGFWSLGTDALTDVTGWAPYLAAAGFPVLNYGQTGPRDRLVAPLQELRAILDAIDTQQDFEAVRGRRIVLLGHSRGGILARMLLAELAATASPLLARVDTCITLHSPNQGSTLANAALSLAALVNSWRVTGVPLVPPELQALALTALDGLLQLVAAEVGYPAYADFTAGAPTLLQLAAAEPVPGVTYFTFGGIRPVLLNLRGWAFTPDSTIPLVHLPPWHWYTVYVPLLPVPPPGLVPFPEVLEGGDLLTNSALTRLPFALHRDNYLNHAEALWNPALQAQVAAILGGTPLPQALVVSNADRDGTDPDRAIDALGGIGPTGIGWKLSLSQALAMADAGTPLFVRRPDGGLVPLQRVRRRDGRRYLRALPGGGGPRLAELPANPA